MNNIAEYIDHTLLKPDAKKEAIAKICDEAKQHHFKSVCVNSCHCRFVAEQLAGSGVNTCCVVGFPLGAMATEAKAYEATLCVQNGADEVDMVINVPKDFSELELRNGYKIRRAAIDYNVPLFTNTRLATAFIRAFCSMSLEDLQIKSWDQY